MKTVFIFLLMSIGFVSISQAIIETEFFVCQSNIENFGQFRVTQLVDETVAGAEPKYIIKVDFTSESWRQVGPVKMADVTPIFEGKFRKNIPPADPLNPLPKPLYPEYLYLSINSSGSGGVSINGDMQPVKCTKLVQLPI